MKIYGPKTGGNWGIGVSLVGPRGIPGVPGDNTILNGTTPPDEYDGSDGDFYIDTVTHTIYGPRIDGDWGIGTSLIGPAGEGTGGGGATKDITQASHGFAVGDVLKFASGVYAKAQANTVANAEVVGIVSAVSPPDSFTLLQVGFVSGLSGLTTGSAYFLSDATSGLLAATEPTDAGSISKPLFIAVSTTEGYFFNMRGIINGVVETVSDAAYGSGWNGVTAISPSKNAIYDKIALVDAVIQYQVNMDPEHMFAVTMVGDGSYIGYIITATAGTALAFGDLCYLQASDSRWEKTDADAEATAGPVMLGMCVMAANADGDITQMLLWGRIRADAKFPTLTQSAPAYVGVTAGEIQVAAPSGAADIIRIVGHAEDANTLSFHPSNDWMEVA